MITEQAQRPSTPDERTPMVRAVFGTPVAGYSGPVYAPYAGFASRAAAMVVDLLLIFTIYVVVGISWEFFRTTSGLPWLVDYLMARFAWLVPIVTFFGSPAFAVVLLLALSFGYFAFFFALGGATIGKYLFGLRVVTAGGRRLPPRRAVLRALAYAFSALALYLGFLAVLTDDRRRGWHDKIARTVVIYKWRATPISARIDNRKP